MDKVAKADPMKKGYIVGQTIKGGLKGAGIGGGIGAGYSGFKMLNNLPDTPTKKNLVGLGVRTALGVGIGATAGASSARSKAIDARIEANIPKEEQDRLSRMRLEQNKAWDDLDRIEDSVYKNTESIEDGYEVSTVTAKQKRALQAAQKKYDALEEQYRNAKYNAEKKSKKDLIARGLLKKASEQRLGPGHTLKRTGQGATIGGIIGGIGIGAGTASLKGLAAGTAIGAGLGGMLGYNQGKGERRDSFADPTLKRKWEKARDAYEGAHQEYEDMLSFHLGDDPDNMHAVLTKKEHQKLDKIRTAMAQREAELDAAHKAYKESARQNFKNRHNKTASVSSFDKFTKEAGITDKLKDGFASYKSILRGDNLNHAKARQPHILENLQIMAVDPVGRAWNDARERGADAKEVGELYQSFNKSMKRTRRYANKYVNKEKFKTYGTRAATVAIPAAAALYGTKKLYDKHKAKKAERAMSHPEDVKNLFDYAMLDGKLTRLIGRANDSAWRTQRYNSKLQKELPTAF